MAADETKASDSPAGRVWLVTGAGSGFGRAIAEAALGAGDAVLLGVRRPEQVEELVAGSEGRAEAIELDVTRTDRAGAVVAAAIERRGRIDVLVNCAGRGLLGAVEETTEKELRELMELHFFGPAALTDAVLPSMRERGSGAIVQLSSMGGRISFAGVGGYSATKFALEGLSEALAAEVASFGIQVLIVEPGAFRTGFNRSGALLQSPPLDAYRDQIDPTRRSMEAENGKQPGDPAKAAAAILAALDSPEPPLRLVLGSDAVEAVTGGLERERAELAAWEETSRRADFDA